MHFFRFKTIGKNLAFLVFVAVLPALAILLYTGIEQRRDSIATAQRNALLLTQSMAEVQQNLANSCRQLLSTLALLPEIRALNPEASNTIFAAIIEKNPTFHNISLNRLDGQVIAAGRGFKKINLADRKHFREALNTLDFVAGEYVLSRLGPQTPILPYAFPVLDSHGNVKAILTIAVRLDIFTRLHHTAKLPDDSFIAATDRQGIRLFYYPPKEATNPIGEPIKQGAWEIARKAEQPGFFTRKGSDQARRIFAYQQARLYPDDEPYLYLWAGIPEQPILDVANNTLLRNLLLLLLATSAALLVSWLIARNRLIAPLQALVDLTGKFSAGDFNARLESGFQPREIDSLANAFHDMAESIATGQQALQNNEARFRTVMDSLDAVVYVADMESYQLLFINKYGRRMFGDVAGKICWQTLQENQTGPCSFCTNRYLLDNNGQPGEAHNWEFQNSATGHWYHMQDRAIHWPDGRIVRLEIATDISARKQTEFNLAEEKERLAVTLKSIGEGVISCDTAGRVGLLNQVAAELTGWDPDDAVGRPLSEVFQPIDENSGQPGPNLFEKALGNGTIYQESDQTVLVDHRGVKRNIASSCAPIQDQNGEISGAVLVFRDISEKLRNEQELIKIKKLESIGVLAGGIAHDFNNILAAILGNIDITLRDSQLGERSRRLLTQAQNASYRARDLTHQLLTFAKGGQPVKEAASLPEVVKESAEFTLRGDKVACRYQFPDNLWPVDIDKGQISQVVQNIIINASNAMPSGGLINITAENIAADQLRAQKSTVPSTQDWVKLEIADSGVGIPASLLEKIFDPYFTTKQQGSGLGLAITHSIISKHGGSISVDSTPDVGTIFTIYLPASEPSAIITAGEETVATSNKQARILVMDDEALLREIATEMLQEMGHQVISAEDGEQALQLYKRAMETGDPIDIVIMDLTVPGGIGGKEATEMLLATDSKARVIVSSGYSNDPIMANYADYGFSAAIAKPYQFADLSQLINQLLTAADEKSAEKISPPG